MDPRIVPDQIATDWPAPQLLPAIGGRKPAQVLDDTLRAIATRYGMRTADFVATQLEYPQAASMS